LQTPGSQAQGSNCGQAGLHTLGAQAHGSKSGQAGLQTPGSHAQASNSGQAGLHTPGKQAHASNAGQARLQSGGINGSQFGSQSAALGQMISSQRSGQPVPQRSPPHTGLHAGGITGSHAPLHTRAGQSTSHAP
jgi:hypothetical protein